MGRVTLLEHSAADERVLYDKGSRSIADDCERTMCSALTAKHEITAKRQNNAKRLPAERASALSQHIGAAFSLAEQCDKV